MIPRAQQGAALLVGVTIALSVAAQTNDGPSPLRGFDIDPAWIPLVARPASHDADWLETHGPAAALVAGESECTSCHTDGTCASCHAAENVAASVHPAGYLLLHGPDALATTGDCASCHTTSRFCRSCHLDAELSSAEGYRSPGWDRVHPEGWLEPGGHASEARFDLLSCVSCHAGEECATCHVHVSPHGDAFADDCATMLRAAEATCASCHTAEATLPLDAIRAMPGCTR